MIRPANPADAAAIAHIHVATWQATYTGIVPESYLSSLNETDFTTRWTDWLGGDPSISIAVAETHGHLAGFAAGGPLRKPISGYDAELYALYVLPSAQNSGVGTALVKHIAQNLCQEGRTHLLVWVLRDNPASAVYRHWGATPVTEDIVEIGGATLPELAFGWPLALLAPGQNRTPNP